MKNNDKSERKTETFFEIAAKKKKEILLDIIAKDSNRKVIGEFREKNNIPEEGLSGEYGYKIAHLVEYPHGHSMSVGNLEGMDKLVDSMIRKENFTTERKAREMSVLVQYYIIFGEQGLEMHLHDSDDIIFGCSIDGKENYFGIDSSTTMAKISEDFPLVIRFRPNTNQRDLITFIQYVYKSQITPRKNTISAPAKRTRIKTRRSINQIIYDNRLKTSDEICDLIKERFDGETADKYRGYDNIRAIINLEEKRRETEK